jgi:hypothetical protein
VKDDWCAWLPRDKAQAFSAYQQELESHYVMFSVSLNEAFEYRRTGLVSKSYQAVAMTPGLCIRFTDRLGALLRALTAHAKHYGTVPNSVPLDACNFQGAKEQRTARMSNLLSRVLLTQRSQFLHKTSTLEEMVADLAKDFALAVDDLSQASSSQPEADWRVADAAHYDLNTCLREAIVLLKSFLLVLPQDQLGSFQRTVRSHVEAPSPAVLTGQGPVRPGRTASVGRQ